MDPAQMDFMNGELFSQWAISESALECWFNTIGRSDIGTLYLNGPKINEMMNHPAVSNEFTSTTMKQHIPVIYEKIGAGKELTMEWGWKDVKVLLGNYDADVILEYTMRLMIGD